jgi:hypothetical protein
MAQRYDDGEWMIKADLVAKWTKETKGDRNEGK